MEELDSSLRNLAMKEDRGQKVWQQTSGKVFREILSICEQRGRNTSMTK